MYQGEGFQFFVEMTCLGGSDLSYSKGLKVFGKPDPPPTQKNIKFDTFIISNRSERPPTQFVWVAPYEILVFLSNIIFSANERAVLLQTHIWEKSVFF